MIHSLLESNMREAIANPDNQFKDGSINWNFVDADAYHACYNFFRNDADFYESFHDIAEKIANEMNPQTNEIQLEMEV
jgi:glutamate-1-semialdehyde aminotransferase